jgi:hypothetical protein
MKYCRPAQSLIVIAGLSAGLILGCPAGFAADESPPEVTTDGLHLYKQTKERLAYVQPGATFTQYKRLAILDCDVEFSQDWVQDYNRDQRDLSRRIKPSDLERAKAALQKDFKKVFTQALQQGGRYQVTDSRGPDVLELRPGLVDIRVNAPDLMSAGRSASYVESAGEMTLYLELWDSGSNTLLARVTDVRVDPRRYGQRASSVTNQAAANRLMRSWADELRTSLDLVRGKDVTR